MTDVSFTLADDGPDDLPRTLRREHEARARAKEKEQARAVSSSYAVAPAASYDNYTAEDDAMPAVVKRIDVPFFRLVFFFLKAALAAIPAIILLAVLAWYGAELLQTYFPNLMKFQILIMSSP